MRFQRYAVGLETGRSRRTAIYQAIEDHQRLLLALGLLVAYVPLLLRSFWVDETAVYWMARGGPAAALARTSIWPGQPLLYSAISSLFCFGGGPLRDLLLRLPALIGAAALCYFVYRFAEDAIGEGAGRIAAILTAFHPATVLFATQARPYTLAMAAFTASAWALFRWIRDGDRRWLFWWILATTLVVNLHYLFAVAFIVQVIYLAVTRRGVVGMLLASVAVCVLLVPLIPNLRLLFRASGTLPFMPPPQAADLASVLLPPWFILGIVLAGLLMWQPGTWGRAATPWRWLTMAWWLAGPLLLFLVSRASAMRIFVPRYLTYSAVGFTLLLCGPAWRFLGAQRAAVWALAAGLLTTAFSIRPGPGPEELGPLFTLVRQEAGSPPLIFTSEYPESNANDWRAGNTTGSYLYAPIVAFDVRNRLIPLPNRIDDSARQYVASVLAGDLGAVPKVMMVTRDPNWVRLVAAEFVRAGFSYRWTQPNSFYVVKFEKTSAAGVGSGRAP